MPDDGDAISKVPNELLLRILKHLYPPAAFRPFDINSICPEDSAWHEDLLNAHLDMVNVSKVSRLFHRLSVSVAESHARVIKEDEATSLFLRMMNQFCLTHWRKPRKHSPGWTLGANMDLTLSDSTRLIDHLEEKLKESAAAGDKDKSFDSVRWFDIGHNHAHRVIRCGNIMTHFGLILDGFVQGGLIARFRTSKMDPSRFWMLNQPRERRL